MAGRVLSSQHDENGLQARIEVMEAGRQGLLIVAQDLAHQPPQGLPSGSAIAYREPGIWLISGDFPMGTYNMKIPPAT